jgi:chaperonin cofactor prefoldin
MSDPIKQKITANLDKAKGEGKVRAEHIREIIRDAVSQTVAELKEGTDEIGTIVKDAISTMIADLRLRGRQDPEEIAASIEGAIEGGTYQKQQEIARQRAKLQELQAQIDEQERQLHQQIGGALIDIDAIPSDDSMQPAISNAVSAAKESQASGVLQQQYFKLKIQLESLDRRLEERYGDRYGEVKRKWEDAKTWYENTKAEAEANDTIPLSKKQSEVEGNLGNLGAVVARKEQEVKERLQDLWQTKVGSQTKR